MGNEASSGGDGGGNDYSGSDNLMACVHNDRPGVSAADVVEHVGNGEFGSAGRDVADVISGHQDFSGANQAPSNSSSSTA